MMTRLCFVLACLLASFTTAVHASNIDDIRQALEQCST